MIPLEIRPKVAISENQERAVRALGAGQRTLEDVIRWGLSQCPPAVIVNVVVQDEYTHDVVIAHPAGFYLVYDTT
jgi:hypothetical protein